MQKMESEMKRVEQEIVAGRHRTDWFATINLPYSVGSGRILDGNRSIEVDNITSATFWFEYQNGAWYETTAYPNARAHHRKRSP